jgi:signal transduction histidine kinase
VNRTRLAVVLGGLVLAVLIGWSQRLPADDLALLVGIAFGAAALLGGAGAVLLARVRGASLHLQAVIVALASVGATAVGTLAAAKAMFVSQHDLTALFVVLTAAATVGLLGAVELGGRVGEASRTLGDMTRRIVQSGGRIPAAALHPESSTAELDRLAHELTEMSRQLDEARERERSLERARRELVAWVSHDLRTPLAGIRAMVEALQDGVVADPETVDHYHQTIHSETARLAQLVDDLFELSRIQADALSLTWESALLGDVVSDALGSTQALADARGVRLASRAQRPMLPLRLATPEMSRVLRNLLDNAIRHTPPGGVVTVEVGMDDDAAYVVVADECGGIPGDDLDRVFDPAYRGDAARTPGGGTGRGGAASGGVGLGLAIARGLVEAHGGEVGVRNGGAGCRFTIRLPLDGDAPPALGGPARSASAPPAAM